MQKASCLSTSEPHERETRIETPEGPMRALVVHPSTDGAYPAIVMIHHIGGLSPTMRLVARRLAGLGMLCVVPALYHRLGEIVLDPVDPEPTVAAIRSIAVGSLTPERLRTDVGAVLDWLAHDTYARSGPLGLIGFGGGAGQAMRLAADFPDAFRLLISILGVGFVRPGAPDSPHLRLGELSGGAYFGFAENDEIIPASAVADLRRVLATARLDAEVVVHPGVRHGYPFADRAAYDAAAAEADWTRVAALVERNLNPLRGERA